MLNFDQINDSVRNDFAGNGIDASLVVGRAHRTSPGLKPSGKRLSTAYLATPVVEQPRVGVVPVSEPRSQEPWCRRQRQGMSCCMTASGQAPAAIWASLILNQQATL